MTFKLLTAKKLSIFAHISVYKFTKIVTLNVRYSSTICVLNSIKIATISI
ncbi:hypothetical protein ADIARSV_2465 [Arcticibacter svalbardensis MN12-7]|uniref:Uncharacterized protein n=1 Tax=Arcticibacter svalbardensis MN12-7 TaxID=1150600 RepID=R9GRQ7_9SPHI|nr:hypothetical protein ADIARSV_2465 [Arcticibacter svalbardensis MN12-7]